MNCCCSCCAIKSALGTCTCQNAISAALGTCCRPGILKCCLSMSTVNPTPGICQNPCGKSQSAAGSFMCAMKSVANYGSTLVGALSGAGSCAVTPCGVTKAKVSGAGVATPVTGNNTMMLVIVGVIALVIVLYLVDK